MNNNLIKRNNCRQQGFSIVELMIAIVIGTIILTGLVTIFDTTSSMNRTQNGLARLQENGRFITVQMKTALDQAGYQYCLSSTGEEREVPYFDGISETYSALPSTIEPWRVIDNIEVFAGVPSAPFFDPQYFIKGHECDTSSCEPSLTSPGSDQSVVIPGIGVGNGQRIAGTDVLTVRYIHGEGVAVDRIGELSGNNQIITYEDYELNDPSVTLPQAGAKILLASCSPNANHVVSTLTTLATLTTIDVNNDADVISTGLILPKVFDLDRDMRSLTYYVANNVVDGRDVPTLYGVQNGVVNALVEGVDRFDVLYTVQTNTPGSYLLLDANGVESMDPGLCTEADEELINATGCGWRSVVSIEFHLLLNTVADSSSNANDVFFYSVDGDQPQTAVDLPSSINHYRMHRREFYSVVATKNWN